jgi:hypothetical protein
MSNTVPQLTTLDDFVETLRAQRGLHRKVRLIGHYWRQIRDLPADDRQRVALALGSESAWRRLEKLFAADGHLSEGEIAVKRALRRVGKADPEELRIMASRLRSGDYAEVGSELLTAMSQALDEEAGLEAADESPEREPEPEPESQVETAPESEPMPESRPEPESESESEPDPEPAAVAVAVAAAAAEPEPEQDRHSPNATISGGGAPDDPARHERLQRLAAIGGGWRARRLLGLWIREQHLDDLDEALALAEQLVTASDFTWCLADIVQHWPLDDSELAAVLDAAPSASVRRRLQRRQQLRSAGRATRPS